MRPVLWMAWLIGCGLPCAGEAGVLRVPSEYPTIQAGVDAASAGDSVVVAPGTYTDIVVRTLGFPNAACVFLKGGVALVSEGGSDVTTIDMQGIRPPGVSLSQVILGAELGTEGTRVEGFTILGAPVGRDAVYAFGGGHLSLRDCVIRDADGVGVVASAVGLELADCRFERCVGLGVGIGRANLRAERCLFADCEGTALSVFGELPNGYWAVIEDCVFTRNRDLGGNGGGLAVSQYGGGCEVRRCAFLENECRDAGGGASMGNGGLIVVEDCVFRSNRSLASWGGGLKVGASEVRGCTFSGNSSLTSGGAVVVQGGPSVFSNNVIASTTGSVAFRVTSSTVLTGGCNVLWSNAAGDAQNYVFAPTDRILDPLFCDEAAGDLTLQPLSPCLPDFSGGCGRIGALEQGCGTVSIEAESWGQVKAAYREPPGGER